MANNLGLDIFVAGTTLATVGGVTNDGLDLFVAGILYPGNTDGHAVGGGPGPGEAIIPYTMALLGVGG